MASSLSPSSDLIAAEVLPSQRSRDASRKGPPAILRFLAIVSEAWAEARTLQAEANRRYPHMNW